jgi:hypothetical protein
LRPSKVKRYARTVMDTDLRSINLFFVLALATDLLTPFLIWKGILPAYTRWLSDAAVLIMIIGAYARMMVFDRIPRAMWAIAWVSAIGIGVALLRGQSIGATTWGWWIMFRYPLVGIYAYLQPRWPQRFAQLLRNSCTAVLAGEVIIQIGQYLTGEPPGDNLAGTFGEHGTANLGLFIVLVLCLALGEWLALGRWKTLVLVVALGSLSSALGEIKLFPAAVLALGLAALAIHVIQRRQLRTAVRYAVLIGGVVWIFFTLYDRIVVPTRGTTSLEAYLDPTTLADYLSGAKQISDSGRYYGRYHLGRSFALSYAWEAIRGDTTTLLFGWGLGARGESRTFGTAGLGLLQGGLGLSTGTSLLVIMQELGLVGMVLLGGFILWTVVRLPTEARTDALSDATELRYALALFSLLWPLWLWYSKVWGFAVTMLIYWVAFGYVLGEPHRHHLGAHQSRTRKLARQYGEDMEE